MQHIKIRIFCMGLNVFHSSVFSRSRKNVSMADDNQREANIKYNRLDSLDKGWYTAVKVPNAVMLVTRNKCNKASPANKPCAN